MTTSTTVSPSKSKSDPSNTLILSGFSRSDFPAKSCPTNEDVESAASQEDSCLTDDIRQLISSSNDIPIVHWGNLKSFGRVIVVFQSVQDAARAHSVLRASSSLSDGPYSNIKTHFGKHTPLYEAGSDDPHLKLPDQGRLFFISPPPSPPAGWISQLESAPNTETFHSDLHQALSSLREAPHDAEVNPPVNSAPDSYSLDPFPSETVVSPATGKLVRRVTLHTSSSTQSINADDGPVVPTSSALSEEPVSPSIAATPTIVVEWDDDGEADSMHLPSGNSGEPARFHVSQKTKRPPKTERPPAM